MKKTSVLDIHKDTIFCGVYNGKKLNDEFSLKTIKNFRVERYTIFKLCESYRLNRGTHHRIIINFGRLEELETVEQKKLLAKRVEELIVNRGLTLSTSTADEVMEKLARHFFAEIKQKKLYDLKQGKEEMAYHINSTR